MTYNYTIIGHFIILLLIYIVIIFVFFYFTGMFVSPPLTHNLKLLVMTNETNFSTTDETKKTKSSAFAYRPTPAFVGASWLALATGLISYCIGLWNSDMMLNEKGYYFTIILFGLFSAISVQKCVRDKAEGIEVTDIYYFFCNPFNYRIA